MIEDPDFSQKSPQRKCVCKYAGKIWRI